MTDSEFIQRMRDYAIDHEPDGWPAVKMQDITRLCDLAQPRTEYICVKCGLRQEPENKVEATW